MLKGGITRDAEMKHLANGNALLKFGLATEKKWKGNDGEWKKKVTYHNCTIWGKLADQYSLLKKGDKVFVKGTQENDSYEKDGVKKYFSNVNVDEIVLEKPKGESANTENSLNNGLNIESSQEFTAGNIPF